MLQIFQPKVNERMVFPCHVMIWIKSGSGLIEVDFQTYHDFEDRLIFLSPDQYIKFVFGEFEVGKIEFPAKLVANSTDFRVLFKHLISLDYIEFAEGPQHLFQVLLDEHPLSVLDISTRQWFWQNPFRADREEYALIFDVKDLIDQQFGAQVSVEQLLSGVGHERYKIARLFRHRLGIGIKTLAQQKLLLESQREIAFTDKPLKEVAYDLGFRDPAYFHRFFKKFAQKTPGQFRIDFGEQSDQFIQDLLGLIRENHKAQHTTTFYADQTHMSIKTLSRKVRDKMNITVGALVRQEIIRSAQELLQELPVKEVAYELGFEEPQHFSAFYKKYTGISPTQFLSKKYNS